jgi:hypothetical protein
MSTPSYKGWARWGRLWQQVAEGPDMPTCYRLLLAWIARQPRKPPASAVLPAGVNPRDGGHHHGPAGHAT